MIIDVPVMFVGSKASTFTNDSGQLVNFYRVTLIDDDGNPLQLGCPETVYQSSQYIERKSDVIATLSLNPSQKGVSVRCIGLGLA